MASDDVSTLRRAAAKVRETAEAATKGRWSPDGPDGVVSDGPDHLVVFADYGSACRDEDATHIALFDPTVALAVADWLETASESMVNMIEAVQAKPGELGTPGGIYHGDPVGAEQFALDHPAFRNALALARAILREEP